MATPTPADLKTRYPEFSDVDDARVKALMDEAALEMSVRVWGRLYAVGLLALAAHKLKVSSRKRGGDGAGALPGPMTSKKAGEIQVGYASAPMTSTDDAYFAGTAYGQQYLRLRRLVAIPVGVSR
ncbi:hypothetical protein ANDO1_1708 [plant metagenome]|uniref:Uncharacterized protein n=1 Tax=plant metagenome TaxID=1297885 RepID=A0A484P5Y9_9ZZZZ